MAHKDSGTKGQQDKKTESFKTVGLIDSRIVEHMEKVMNVQNSTKTEKI